jgi:RNA polymerase sigma factor (sigma-70 family)
LIEVHQMAQQELTTEERGVGLEVLARVSPSQLAVIELARQGLPQKDIAARLGITQGAVSQNLKRAAKNLKATRQEILHRRANKLNNS